MRVLIVEDEPLAQEELERLIEKKFPQMAIVAKLSTVYDSIEWLRKNTVDLIFMDINLADGNSFDIFEHVEVRTPVIFITAYDQYAIQAFKVNGIGYLLKPIVESDLVAAIKKLDYTTERVTTLLQSINTAKEYKSRVVLKSGDRFSFLEINDVAYFYAEDRVTFVVPKHGRKQLVDYTIEALELMLDPKQFFRLTRGCIASIDSIDGVSKYFNSRLKISLKPQYEGELLVSRVRVSEFLKWLDGE